MGLNLLTGYNGQVSIGHGAFFGVGDVHDRDPDAVARLAVHSRPCRSRPRSRSASACSSGFPALRVKGLYLALVTLGLAVLFPQLTNRFVPHDLCPTCGTSQVGELPRVKLLPPSWAPTFIGHPDQWAYYATLAITVIAIIASFLIVRSRFGRALIAVRDHEAAAETVGINIARVKVIAFATSALYAGVAGSCFVLVKRLATASAASVFQLSIEFLVAVVIGGTATVLGPLIGGIIVVFSGRWISESFPSTDLVLAHRRLGEESPLAGHLRHRADPAHVRPARRHRRRRAAHRDCPIAEHAARDIGLARDRPHHHPVHPVHRTVDDLSGPRRMKGTP